MSESTLAPTTSRATLALLAPVSGVIVPLEEVPDPVFAQRLAGDGLSIDPLGSEVVAPCDAVVRQVHRALHEVTLEASGLEIVIHVGLDTVLLRGAGFHPAVKAGQQVRAGDVFLRFDVDAVARRARSLTRPPMPRRCSPSSSSSRTRRGMTARRSSVWWWRASRRAPTARP